MTEATPNRSLSEFPLAMAAAVRPLLPGLDRAAYVRFLDAMVHYTRGSGSRLEHAAERAARFWIDLHQAAFAG